MKRILVTGGAGFLGSHLCERLKKSGSWVICLDNFFTGTPDNGRFADEVIRHDVCEPFHLEVDEIYHLACPASPIHYQRNPVRTIRTCVQGTLNALTLARDVGARIMIASTSEVYGDPSEHPQTEHYWGHVNPIGPRACYDEGKRCAEALAVSYAVQYGVQIRIARIFNTYGPRMHENDGRVVSNFIVQAIKGDHITIYGDGKQTRSFCYVDDTIEGFLKLMASSVSSPVNLGNPNEITIRMLAEKILAMRNWPSKIVSKKLPQDDPRQRRPDISRAIALLDWSPKVSIEEGLKSTINDFVVRLRHDA